MYKGYELFNFPQGKEIPLKSVYGKKRKNLCYIKGRIIILSVLSSIHCVSPGKSETKFHRIKKSCQGVFDELKRKIYVL